MSSSIRGLFVYDLIEKCSKFQSICLRIIFPKKPEKLVYTRSANLLGNILMMKTQKIYLIKKSMMPKIEKGKRKVFEKL